MSSTTMTMNKHNRHTIDMDIDENADMVLEEGECARSNSSSSAHTYSSAHSTAHNNNNDALSASHSQTTHAVRERRDGRGRGRRSVQLSGVLLLGSLAAMDDEHPRPQPPPLHSNNATASAANASALTNVNVNVNVNVVTYISELEDAYFCALTAKQRRVRACGHLVEHRIAQQQEHLSSQLLDVRQCFAELMANISNAQQLTIQKLQHLHRKELQRLQSTKKAIADTLASIEQTQSDYNASLLNPALSPQTRKRNNVKNMQHCLNTLKCSSVADGLSVNDIEFRVHPTIISVADIQRYATVGYCSTSASTTKQIMVYERIKFAEEDEDADDDDDNSKDEEEEEEEQLQARKRKRKRRHKHKDNHKKCRKRKKDKDYKHNHNHNHNHNQHGRSGDDSERNDDSNSACVAATRASINKLQCQARVRHSHGHRRVRNRNRNRSRVRGRFDSVNESDNVCDNHSVLYNCKECGRMYCPKHRYPNQHRGCGANTGGDSGEYSDVNVNHDDSEQGLDYDECEDEADSDDSHANTNTNTNVNRGSAGAAHTAAVAEELYPPIFVDDDEGMAHHNDDDENNNHTILDHDDDDEDEDDQKAEAVDGCHHRHSPPNQTAREMPAQITPIRSFAEQSATKKKDFCADDCGTKQHGSKRKIHFAVDDHDSDSDADNNNHHNHNNHNHAGSNCIVQDIHHGQSDDIALHRADTDADPDSDMNMAVVVVMNDDAYSIEYIKDELQKILKHATAASKKKKKNTHHHSPPPQQSFMLSGMKLRHKVQQICCVLCSKYASKFIGDKLLRVVESQSAAALRFISTLIVNRVRFVTNIAKDMTQLVKEFAVYGGGLHSKHTHKHNHKHKHKHKHKLSHHNTCPRSRKAYLLAMYQQINGDSKRFCSVHWILQNIRVLKATQSQGQSQSQAQSSLSPVSSVSSVSSVSVPAAYLSMDTMAIVSRIVSLLTQMQRHAITPRKLYLDLQVLLSGCAQKNMHSNHNHNLNHKLISTLIDRREHILSNSCLNHRLQKQRIVCGHCWNQSLIEWMIKNMSQISQSFVV